MTASALWLAPTTAQAAPVTTMAPGAVQAISDPGATLAAPADGRINGYGFAGQVTGVGTGPADPGASIRAPAGQVLWVFGVRFQVDVTPTADGTTTQTQPSAVLSYDGERVPVPLSQPATPTASAAVPPTVDSGVEYFAAAVPTGATDVVLEMASGGFAQDFSLSHMAREGVSPASLYRDPQSWQSIDNVAGTQVLTTPYSSPDGSYSLPGASLTIGLDTATLSYFGPDGTTDPAATPTGAWLFADLSDPFNPNNDDPSNLLEYSTPLNPSDLQLTWPSGLSVHPTSLPGGPDPLNDQDITNRLFENRYVFAVPATLTSATLTITIPTEQVYPAGSGEPATPIKVGTATFHLTFPAASAPVAPLGAATTPARLSQPGSSGVSLRGSGSSTWFIALLIVAVVGAVGGVTIWRRNRRRPTAPPLSGRRPIVIRELERPNRAERDGESSDDDSTTDPPPDRDATGTPRLPFDGPEPTAHPVEPAAANGSSKPVLPSTPVLVAVPAGPIPPNDGVLRVAVLGPVELIGWPAGMPVPGQTQLELLTFLALNPGRQYTAEQLRTGLGRGRTRDLDVASIRRYIGELRRVLGDRIPDSRKLGAYQLTGVETDVALFERAVQIAAAADDPVGQADALAEALAMVRGVPFADSPGEAFGWTTVEDMVAARLSNDVRSAAINLADLALAADDAALATWALDRGQKVWPGDEALDMRALSAAALARPSRLEQTWAAITGRRILGEKVDPSSHLQAHYRQLVDHRAPSNSAPMSPQSYGS